MRRVFGSLRGVPDYDRRLAPLRRPFGDQLFFLVQRQQLPLQLRLAVTLPPSSPARGELTLGEAIAERLLLTNRQRLPLLLREIKVVRLVRFALAVD